MLSTDWDKLSVFDSGASARPFEQATKLTNIFKVESLQQVFLGSLLFPDGIVLYHTSGGFLGS